jgi:DNA-binding NarL/FixJ family response regulator
MPYEPEPDVQLNLVPPTSQGDQDWAYDRPIVSSATGVNSVPTLAPLRVLIVDDAPSTRRYLRAVLEHCREFHVVGEASDGDGAVAQVEALQPDLVLLDLSMPNSDGASALEGILAISPNAVVIVVSGMNRTVSGMMLDAGAAAFVPKGLSPFDLIDRLGNILGRSITVDDLADLEDASRSGSQATLGMQTPPRADRRAVVFEGDPTVRDLITAVLEGCRVSVIAETNSSSTALAVVDIARPELVVLDVASRGVPDTSIISDICRRSPSSVVVVYSRFEEWRERALTAGAATFVLKPHLDDLGDRIRQFIPTAGRAPTMTASRAGGLDRDGD